MDVSRVAIVISFLSATLIDRSHTRSLKQFVSFCGAAVIIIDSLLLLDIVMHALYVPL
jgi:hypothetical protein